MKTYTIVFPTYYMCFGLPASVKVRAHTEEEAIKKAEAKAFPKTKRPIAHRGWRVSK